MTWLLPLAAVPFPPKLPLLCPLSMDVWSTKQWKKLLSSVKRPTRSKDICNDLSIGLTSLDRLQPLLLGLPLLVVLDFFSLNFPFQTFILLTHLDVPQPLLLQEPLLHLVTLEVPLPQLRELPLNLIQLGANIALSHRITSRGCCLPLSAS